MKTKNHLAQTPRERLQTIMKACIIKEYVLKNWKNADSAIIAKPGR